ncbi:DNA recombination protein RmuC [Caenibius tardaugens NBRC 16725]|uniref:DNA recombination protein RmuC homolog n=1 Tax=Caenibius tardaugens NBRC 16725 TaxID=1219035 RepID=U2YJ08_9SPHN|nr:DNA recombination protein RmuC [Caenibius tardaugens]AZI34644.1 DNA recombination protein RmuC [Caenibius tardaugens NBRC 16725]GAD48152.1 DNA recombination protein RmuC [Caenibius tardaugens NBRC 16725]
MDSTLLVLVVLVAGLVLGVAAGWFFGSRPVADWRARHAARDAEARDLDEKFRRAIVELEGASVRAERADSLAETLEQVRAEHVAGMDGARRVHGEEVERLRGEHGAVLERTRGDLMRTLDQTRAEHAQLVDALRREQRELASELAQLREKSANFDEQKRLLVEAREELLKEFQNTGSAVLTKAQEAFLARANERFGHAEKSSEDKIRALLHPVGERLKRYEEQVETLEKQRVNAFGELTGLINSMREGQEQVRREAQRLGNSLTNAPKARGRWGEQQLKNLLETCGLSQHTDFQLEHSIETEDGRLRPDAIVRIPGGKQLVIDAKVSLNAYQQAFEADGDDARKAALTDHVRSMRNHVQQLSAKSYQSQFEDAPDYVVMFVPGEHFVAAALEFDPTLWDFAFEKKVLLATPTNLVAIARTVAQVWRQDGLAREAREIGRLGADLHDRIAIAAEHLKRVGSGLDTAVNNYNKFVGSFERNVLSAARKLKDKGIETGRREAEDVPLVESAPRYTGAQEE